MSGGVPPKPLHLNCQLQRQCIYRAAVNHPLSYPSTPCPLPHKYNIMHLCDLIDQPLLAWPIRKAKNKRYASSAQHSIPAQFDGWPGWPWPSECKTLSDFFAGDVIGQTQPTQLLMEGKQWVAWRAFSERRWEYSVCPPDTGNLVKARQFY